VACDGLADGRFVARNTRNQRGAVDAVPIEFRDPPIRERVGGDWIVPLQLAADLRR